MSLQGKMLVFGRDAIMLNETFWGMSIVAIDFDKLVAECGLDKSDLGFDYAIATYKADGKTIDYTYGDSSVLDEPDAYTDIKPNDCTWRIAIKYKPKLSAILLSYGVFVLASLLIGVAVYAIIKALERKLERSKTDPLTNTITGEEFKKRAINKLKNSRDGVFAMLSIELDGYREIENIYGHIAGDKVLVCTADRIRSAIRTDDLISRVSGYEFLILLSDIRSEEQVLKVIKRIKELSEQYISICDGETLVNVFLSVGYAVSSPEGSDYMVLYKTADERMYADKNDRHNNL
jgi:diguanylate cyclase (GGDEF)-like protein